MNWKNGLITSTTEKLENPDNWPTSRHHIIVTNLWNRTASDIWFLLESDRVDKNSF